MTYIEGRLATILQHTGHRIDLHSHLTMSKGEDLRRVCEGNWTFSWGVEGCEDEDEEGDQWNTSRVVSWNPEAEASGK